ncbi:hypothetical protein Fcan01_17968 [Folsomia candida]|uniref:Uncharacterized protein n=1 Tax=Folsomia candida TaxID=158441 RepID=A0A226DU11_FOLCA|nr:hypothetical protein Fcan01_17968 [Folsomia candida]
MFGSISVRLKTIALFISLQLLDEIICKLSEDFRHVSIPELLPRSEYCHVKIVYDNIGDHILQPGSSISFHPITLIHINGSDYSSTPIKSAMELSKLGNSKCRVSFIVFEFYFPGNLTLHQPYYTRWMGASDHQYKHGKPVHSSSFIYKNVFKILVSATEKSKFNTIFEYPYRTPDAGSPIFDYLGVLFLSQDGTFSLCVQPIGVMSKSIYTMNCKNSANEEIVPLFSNLLSIPMVWRLDIKEITVAFMNSEFVDISKLAFYANPFNRLSNTSVYQHLLQSVFCHANASLHYHDNPRRHTYGARLGISFMDSTSEKWARRRLVAFRFHGYRFITCYSETIISFKFYVSPFQPLLWGMLVASVVTVSIVLILFKKLKNINSYQAFCPWSFVLANIFEETGYVPVHLERQHFFRFVIGSWIMISVILTNCYNGLMISSLNSPLPETNIPETFQDLICQEKDILNKYKEGVNLTGWISTTTQEMGQRFSRPPDSTNCYKILSPDLVGFFMLIIVTAFDIVSHFIDHQLHQFGDVFHQWIESIPLDTIVILLLGKRNSLTFGNFTYSDFHVNNWDNMSIVPPNTINDEILKCGKSVLVSDAYEMGYKFKDMSRKYFWRKFYRGKDI